MSKCNVQQLVDNAGCFFCLSPGEIQAARLSLLCKIAQKLNPSVSCSPNSLLANATGFVTLDNGMRDVVKAQLLCEIWKGGGSGIIITLPTDPDAAAFVCGWLNICSLITGSCTSTNNCPPGTPLPIEANCASFCQITQSAVDALTTLVTSLKSAGLWDLLDVIYPFVGGNAGSCSLNLKDTTKFAITWHGGVTFSAAGTTGDGATGYGDTGYNPSVSGSAYTLNSAGLGFNSSSNTQTALGGATSITSLGIYVQNSIVGWVGEVNVSDPTFPGVASALAGNFAINRTAANLTTLYTPSGTSSSATASSSLTGFPLFILAINSNSSPINFSPATIKFSWSGAGFTGPQETTLEGIVNTFVASK